MDELFLCGGGKKHYLYRAVDQQGHVVDVLLREHRDLASAEAFFRRAVKSWVMEPDQVVSDHHQPYVKAVKGSCLAPPTFGLVCIGAGVRPPKHRTQPRRHSGPAALLSRCQVCDRRAAFLEGFEAIQALSRGDVLLRQLVPGYRPTLATHQQRVRAVVSAMHVLGARLTKTA